MREKKDTEGWGAAPLFGPLIMRLFGQVSVGLQTGLASSCRDSNAAALVVVDPLRFDLPPSMDRNQEAFKHPCRRRLLEASINALSLSLPDLEKSRPELNADADLKKV